MIPGPVEFEPEVLAALAVPTTSHVAPDFIQIFGSALEQMRQVFQSPDGQPFILAGSGTLAMDTAAANLVEQGDKVLVINTGYFSDRFAAIASRYGGRVTQVPAPVGGRPSLDEVEAMLQQGGYQVMTVTHVDTSTGVINDVQGLAGLARRYGALCVVDGVCSVAAEELRMSEWGVDLVLTASQKAVGTPPGLALVVAGPRALEKFKGRTTPVPNYYADWANWLPVMEAYEARKTGYFGTPAVNLVVALHTSLTQILAEGMETRWQRHMAVSRACKAGIAALGLAQVPLGEEVAAHAMTAPRYPLGVNGAELVSRVASHGVVVAGGLHPAIRGDYFRIGHMGAAGIAEVLATLSAIELALGECGYPVETGKGVAAAQGAYSNY